MSELYDTDFYQRGHRSRPPRSTSATQGRSTGSIWWRRSRAWGRNDVRSLRSNLRVVLLHLLKWRYQPERRSASWQDSIDEHRTRIHDLIADSPSRGFMLKELFPDAYAYARRRAARQTQLPISRFAEACPWTLEQVLDDKKEA